MKKAKRILLVIVAGFLAFAPPGTLLFGVPFVIATAGVLLQKHCGVKHDPSPIEKNAPAPHASPIPTTPEKR